MTSLTNCCRDRGSGDLAGLLSDIMFRFDDHAALVAIDAAAALGADIA